MTVSGAGMPQIGHSEVAGVEEAARITENKELAPGIFKMSAHAPRVASLARAGQFANLYLDDGAHLLPRPLSIADVCGDTLSFVYAIVGVGSALLSEWEPGRELRLLGPQGNGFETECAEKGALLVGGGLGVPPLLFAARELNARGVPVTTVLGYKNQSFLYEELAQLSSSCYVVSENADIFAAAGSVAVASSVSAASANPRADMTGAARCAENEKIPGRGGTVLDLLEEISADGLPDMKEFTVFSCGPKPMLNRVAAWAASQGLCSRLSLEERMGCGYGACVGCTLRLRVPGTDAEVRRKVCVDGPVFDGSDIIWD
jgi:dihydroorotate dehydrogenase electron transfer subunit